MTIGLPGYRSCKSRAKMDNKIDLICRSNTTHRRCFVSLPDAHGVHLVFEERDREGLGHVPPLHGGLRLQLRQRRRYRELRQVGWSGILQNGNAGNVCVNLKGDKNAQERDELN